MVGAGRLDAGFSNLTNRCYLLRQGRPLEGPMIIPRLGSGLMSADTAQDYPAGYGVTLRW